MRAAAHVVDSLARQDARSPRDAAIASLGRDATESQIADWISRYRAETTSVADQRKEE
jgi:hypothetical protein